MKIKGHSVNMKDVDRALKSELEECSEYDKVYSLSDKNTKKILRNILSDIKDTGLSQEIAEKITLEIYQNYENSGVKKYIDYMKELVFSKRSEMNFILKTYLKTQDYESAYMNALSEYKKRSKK